MISTEKKLSILEEILGSQDFNASPSYKKLLTYLVESSIDNVAPKEQTIAIDVFEKTPDFNPAEDSKVRVYVSNLRKKLENYYNNEGKDKNIRIEIPKGHYHLEFVDTSIKKKVVNVFSSKSKQLYLLGALIIVIAFLTYKTISLSNYESITKHQLVDSFVWNNLYESKLPKMVVLGDDFFFLGQDEGNETIFRKHFINSEEELRTFQEQNPNKIVSGKTPYSFVPMISIKPLLKIIPLLPYSEKNSLQYSSNIKSEDLKNNDIIFIGSFRNLYLLKQALKDHRFDYSIGSGVRANYVTLHLKDSTYTFRLDGQPSIEHSDYCLFRKMPGPNNNTIYMFISFFESAMFGTTDLITNAKYLEKLQLTFQNKFKSLPEYFDILFKTSGYSRTAFTTKIEFCEKIDPSKVKW